MFFLSDLPVWGSEESSKCTRVRAGGVTFSLFEQSSWVAGELETSLAGWDEALVCPAPFSVLMGSRLSSLRLEFSVEEMAITAWPSLEPS